MYPTTRQMTDMPNTAIRAMKQRYGEHLPVLCAEQATNRARRAAVDREEHCCVECDDMDMRHEEY